ncbi:MAG: DUF695 domain-containing protein [Candidatus Obscuribacterales bacterium]|nr:DUF695 domain-containing protein [Cyanobacteria bacterium SZAS LIN-5]
MTWTVHQRQIEGRTAQILLDDYFVPHAPVKDLVLLSGFSLYCRQEPVNTLWHPDEADTLDTIEERLINLCEKYAHGWSVYVMRMATFGVREYYFYHSASAELPKAYAELKNLTPDYRIEFATVNDPDWTQYRKCMTAQD